MKIGEGKAVLFLRACIKFHLLAHRRTVWERHGKDRSLLASSTHSDAPVMQYQIADPLPNVSQPGEQGGLLSG